MEPTVTITRARHAWPEKDGFTISRPRGISEFTFLHFLNSVELLVDGEIITTMPDTCIIYAANTPQWFRSIVPLRHDWMHMTGEVAASLEAAGLEADKVYLPGNSKFITGIIREIEFELLAKPTGYRDLAHVKYRELLLKLARSCSYKESVSRLKPSMEEQLMQVRSQVFSQLERSWSIAEMAALAYLSPSRFHTLYRLQFGISPADDLIRARVDTAKYRLSSTEESVASLAVSLGYRNVTHFCRQFKQHTGITPGQYRQTQNG